MTRLPGKYLMFWRDSEHQDTPRPDIIHDNTSVPMPCSWRSSTRRHRRSPRGCRWRRPTLHSFPVECRAGVVDARSREERPENEMQCESYYHSGFGCLILAFCACVWIHELSEGKRHHKLWPEVSWATVSAEGCDLSPQAHETVPFSSSPLCTCIMQIFRDKTRHGCTEAE